MHCAAGRLAACSRPGFSPCRTCSISGSTTGVIFARHFRPSAGNNGTSRQASRSIPRTARGCRGASYCNFGCPYQAKLSVDVSYLPRAVEKGARIYSDVRVDRVTESNGRVTGVRTTRGDIQCGTIVNATAGWSTLISDMAGVPLPITTHILQAFVTEPLKPFLDVIVVSSQMHIYISQTDRGEFLMCQCAAEADATLEVAKFVYAAEPGACTPDACAGVLRAPQPLAPDVLGFRVELERPRDFDAGQFVLLAAPGVPGYRAYSMCNFERSARRLEFVARRKPAGGFSEWLFQAGRDGANRSRVRMDDRNDRRGGAATRRPGRDRRPGATRHGGARDR